MNINFHSSGIEAKWLTSELYDNCTFNLPRNCQTLNCQTLLQSGCNILHFHQQWMWSQVSLSPHQYLMSFHFFSHSNPHAMISLVVLICIYWWLMVLSVFHVYPLWNCCSCLFLTFKLLVFIFLFPVHVELWEFFVCTRHKFSWRYHLQFLKVCSLSVYPLGIDFTGQLFFNFNGIFIRFPFYRSCFCCQVLKTLGCIINPGDFLFCCCCFPKNVTVLR